MVGSTPRSSNSQDSSAQISTREKSKKKLNPRQTIWKLGMVVARVLPEPVSRQQPSASISPCRTSMSYVTIDLGTHGVQSLRKRTTGRRVRECSALMEGGKLKVHIDNAESFHFNPEQRLNVESWFRNRPCVRDGPQDDLGVRAQQRGNWQQNAFKKHPGSLVLEARPTGVSLGPPRH